MSDWTSPDGKIKKVIKSQGKWGHKPSEGSRCTISIIGKPFLDDCTNSFVTIGDNNGDLWRTVDICLSTMFVGETSSFVLDLQNKSIPLTLELVDLEFDGFIYQWNTSKKYNIALHHKEKGNELFRNNDCKEAAYRFIKALKILGSIPIDIEAPPDIIDSILLSDIKRLKSNLFNNLSSCHFRNQSWITVIGLCTKVLTCDPRNVKALYKIGVAYQNDKNLEKAKEAICRALELEPDNKACVKQLNCLNDELRRAELETDNMMKKMSSGLFKC